MKRTGSCAGVGSTSSASSRKVRLRRLSSALCRKAPQETRLLPHQCAAPSSSSRRADRRGFQKNFPRALKAHVWPAGDDADEIWFEDGTSMKSQPEFGNGPNAERGTGNRRPALRQRLSVRRDLPSTGRRSGPRYADAAALPLTSTKSRATSPVKHAVLLLDRAGWHTTGKLDVPATSRRSSCLPAPRKG